MPFLSEHATQLLVRALVLSGLGYCNALLAGIQACTVKLLQLIQNAAARVVFNEPKRAHVTHKIALVANCRSHQIQDNDVCLQNNNWLCSPIPKLTSSDLCALNMLVFCK